MLIYYILEIVYTKVLTNILTLNLVKIHVNLLILVYLHIFREFLSFNSFVLKSNLIQ